MKRMLATCLLLLMLCTCFVACGDDIPQYNGYKMIANTDVVEYYFYVPESWDVDEQTGSTRAHVSSSDLTNVSMTTFAVPAGVADLATYCANYEADLLTLGTPAYTKQRTPRVFGGVEALEYEYTMQIAGSASPYYFMQIFCFRDGLAHVFTYTAASAEKYQEHAETVTSIVASFAFAS